MEGQTSDSKAVPVPPIDKQSVRVKRKTLQAVLEQCQRALELINNGCVADEDDEEEGQGEAADTSESSGSSAAPARFGDREAEELCDLLKSRVDCPDFLEKLECAQVSVPENFVEEVSSWDVVGKDDLWEGDKMDFGEEDYVVVQQEDIVEGIACFMAAYLLSVKQTKELTPNQLQEALSKTFSIKKKKGKLRKALDGSKVIYNVASWGATAIGQPLKPSGHLVMLYQNYYKLYAIARLEDYVAAGWGVGSQFALWLCSICAILLVC